jgi:replicative DNA helicase
MYAEVLEEYDINIGELPEEHMLWAIEELKATYAKKQVQEWSKDTSRELTEVASKDVHVVLAENASELVKLSMSLESHTTRVDLRDQGPDILERYEARAAAMGAFQGMHFGLPEIDQHTNGIRPGELAVVGAYAKVGKSYFVDRVALNEFQIGRSVALFTLENSIEMTTDRIACLATGIDPIPFDNGVATPEDIQAVREWIDNTLNTAEHPLHILSPSEGEKTAEQIVLKAKLLGADSLIVDQLTFVEPSRNQKRRDLEIRQMMHDFKNLISSGREKLPLLLAHQINREGLMRANKNGYHTMVDFAEGSEVERSLDWGFSMFQPDYMKEESELLFQTLAVRRRGIKNWILNWNLQTSDIAVKHEEVVGV